MKIICSILFVSVFLCLPFLSRAQAGKDGAETISTAGVIFNRYSVVTATASAGTNTITVNNITDLDAANIAGAANNPYTTAALKYGDLIMIVKMQGATINTTNAVAYGTVTANNNAGVYELKTVMGNTGNVISVCGNLANNFVVGGTERVQVVRIPRLSSLTINGASSLTCTPWSGSFKGGIVAIEVNGALVVNGSITTAGLGFRGGVVDNNTTGPPGTSNYVATSSNDGGEKGEGIAGFQTDYDGAGRYDRGAPANGGGGGVSHNSGGGGGANGNNGNTWTGQGVMIVNGSNPGSAWALDPGYIANGNALTNSSGGGRGGYSYGSSDQNATTTGPGNALWGGDNRREIGGLGGRPLTYASNQLYMGGGGGAGDANNSAAQNGANGGGIIYLLVTGNLSGSGTISANGAAAGATISGHNDAPGGGGAGGAIGLNVQGTITGVTITATGGAGGNQLITAAENEGPGGGGGGGFIRTTGTPAVSVTGGSNGTTSSTAVNEFTSNGSTTGASGAIANSQAFVAAPALSCYPLPLTLLSFNASLSSGREGLVKWVSDRETGLLNYEVQVSNDGRQWQTFATVAPRNLSGQQVYTVNTGIVNQQTYYRLRTTEPDRSFSYSDIRVLSVPGKTKLIMQGKTVLLTGLSAQVNTIKIFTSDGRLVQESRTAGVNTVTIQMEKGSSGVYYLRVYDLSGQAETLKFIKQ